MYKMGMEIQKRDEGNYAGEKWSRMKTGSNEEGKKV